MRQTIDSSRDVAPGWTILPGDEDAQVLRYGTALQYVTDNLDRHPERAQNGISYIAVNVDAVFRNPSFTEAPVATIRAVLQCPHLAIKEDSLVQHVLRYAAHRAGVSPGPPGLWTHEDLALMSPTLRDLIPCLATLSISTALFVDLIEPLNILSTRELAAKYKYDALLTEFVASGRTEREMVLQCYNGATFLCDMSQGAVRARATTAIIESSHPHDEDTTEWFVSVSVPGWAGSTLLEFDQRCAIHPEASLRFYSDEDGKDLLGDWHTLWHTNHPSSHSRKYWTIAGHHFWIGFKCPMDVTPLWGWRIRACPVADEAHGDG